MSIVVVGSAALDTVETPAGKVHDALGGSAIYFSTAASYFANVHIVAVVGEDFNLEQIGYLEEKGVDVSGLEVKQGKTFRWGGKYDFDLNDRVTLFTHLNVFEDFAPDVPDAMRDAPYLFLANIQPELQLQVLEQIRAPKLVIMDTMNFWIEKTPEELREVLGKIDVLIINDVEARQLSEKNNLLHAAREILKTGPSILVIKKGEHGAMLVTENELFWAPAFPLFDIQDPTGAGDSFAGGFVGYIAEKNSYELPVLKKAVIYGSIMGSFCVEGFSVDRLKTLTRGEIDLRFKEFIQLTRFE
jgi:sugar/nucleoside kinase (ribokinase family)